MKLKENNLYIARINNSLIKILILEITETSVLWRNMVIILPIPTFLLTLQHQAQI
jgi:hypothetical protein